MRVLLSVAEMATGGAERIVVELTRALRADGDEVGVAADSGPFDRLLEGSGAERYPLPGRGRSPLTAARAVLRVRSATRRFRPAVIHAHNVKATGVAAAARLRPGGRRIPLAATFHGVRPEDYRRGALIPRPAAAGARVSPGPLGRAPSAGRSPRRKRVD